jgi:hypothetical protein
MKFHTEREDSVGPITIQECEVAAPYSRGPGYSPGHLGPRPASDHAATSSVPEIMHEIVPEDPVTAKRVLPHTGT